MKPHTEISETDIAIIGMSLRVSGAADPEAYWKNIRAGIVSVRRQSDEDLRKAGVPGHELAHPHYVPFAAPLEGVGDFDPEFFGFGPKEGAILDPQHRHFYECAWEALESAGHPPETFDGAIGVFAGCGMPWYFIHHVLTNPGLVDSVGLFLLRHTGNDKDFLATRVSYCLDLQGPAINVQTACSTSLVAVHLAVQSLLAGECDMAIAGGVTLEIPHGRGYVYKENEILAPDGVCRPFDRGATGTVFGSGAGAVVLRRLADALRDRDPIRAVIRGSAVNNDGSRKVGYLAPSIDGQAAAIVEALSVSGCEPDTIAYVETHGTGTAVGDPIEFAALTEAFRRATRKQGFCGIGSVKANIGHLDTAAGIASLVKAVKALEEAEIPPTPNFTAPNPRIDLESSPFYVATKLAPWPAEFAVRRAGVTSLGVGGTNAHVVLEQAPAAEATSPAGRRDQLFVLSARTRSAVDGAARKLAAWMREHPGLNPADVAWTLAAGRRAFGERRVVAAQGLLEAAALLEASDTRRVHTHTAKERRSVAFLFPGGGAQHLGMGAGLYESEPVFREHLQRGLELCQSRYGLDLRRFLFPREGDAAAANEELLRPSIQLPAIFLVEYALAQLWLSYGVVPKALAGHSMGENTAACVAGVLSFADTLHLVRMRGELFERVRGGGMLSISAGASEVRKFLPPDLDLATVNAPGLCAVSGTDERLVEFAAELSERGLEAKPIPISIAAHSRLLDPILADFGATLRAMHFSPPRIPFLSNSTGTWITDAQATDPGYWVEHLRNTVRFAEDLEALLADEDLVLLEVGPGKILSSLARAQESFRPGRESIPSLRHAEENLADGVAFTAALGRLWACGVALDLGRLWKDERRARLTLPTYAFDHRRCWIEPGTAAHAALASASVERIQDVKDWFLRPAWREEFLEAPTLERAAGNWLVFLDRAGVGDELVLRLRQRGANVITVQGGDDFRRLDGTSFVLSPERGRESYDALFADLAAHGQLPAHIVHLWLVTADESFRPGSSFFHRIQEQGFYSLFFLAQALPDPSTGEKLRLTVVTNGMQRVGDEPLPHPVKATALGPCRVLPHELTHVLCASVDVDLPLRARRGGRDRGRTLADVVNEVETEVLAGSGSGTVAWRHGRRFLERLERRAIGPVDGAQPTRLREGGVYLITGGLGGIGLEVASWLARSVKARLVLLTRAEFPDRALWAELLAHGDSDGDTVPRVRKILELEAHGAQVLVSATDVTDVEGLEALTREIRERFGALHGVFHAAGVLRDGLISERTQLDAEEVFAPKVHGTLALEPLLDAFELDFTVVFSSTSSWLGLAGQVDYAAANAFLDAWAESRSARGKPTIALAWGIWSAVGMAARVGARGVHARPRGEPATSPFFATKHREPTGLFVLEGAWSSRSHWVLDEHRMLDGRALLPGTGYLELARSALRELGETGPFEIEDLVFVEPLFVPDEGSLAVRVLLRPRPNGNEFEVQSRPAAVPDAAHWLTHAQAKLHLLHAVAPAPVDVAALAHGCTREDPRASPHGTAGVQAERLRFGPRWSVLRARRTGERSAFAELSLAPDFEADLATHALHPALLDIALHAAVDRIPAFGGELWVPMSFDRVRVWSGLERDSVCRVDLADMHSGDEVATYDACLAATDGRVLVEVEGFSTKRLKQGFAASAPPLNPEASGAVHREIADDPTPVSPAESAFRRNLALGIQAHEGVDALGRVLANLRSGRVLVTSLDLEALARQAAALRVERKDTGTKFERPTLSSEYVAPRDEVEQQIVEFWEDLLGVDPVGVKDDFFALGGHSLIAVRLFTRIKKAFHLEFPISVLFEAPTIERCAELVRAARGPLKDAPSKDPASALPARPRFTHLVPMHSGEPAPRPPFFLVAGMFGNVLNLRHLAHLVGGERPFYGIQARGLFGEDAPHETFQEMAAAYLHEIRQVAPHGPYLLGGFSGGGLAAYEMAHQLLDAGEEVAALILLDTPLPKHPPLAAHEKLLIHVQRARKQGLAYIPHWLKNRVRWEKQRRAPRVDDGSDPAAPVFHSLRIEAAFRRALDRYELPKLPLRIALFRPKLPIAHDLGRGRVVNADRELLFHDNGWGPFVAHVDVVEVPGNHDSMVLEPNVRALASRIRKALELCGRPENVSSRR